MAKTVDNTGSIIAVKYVDLFLCVSVLTRKCFLRVHLPTQACLYMNACACYNIC